MITLQLAQELKAAGLVWKTSTHDFFAIPDRDLDDKVFVISNLMVTMNILQGWSAMTFHGTAEWAADYIWTHDVVWIPTETQLREELERLLPEDSQLSLRKMGDVYLCVWQQEERPYSISAPTAPEAYAHALLQMLRELP